MLYKDYLDILAEEISRLGLAECEGSKTFGFPSSKRTFDESELSYRIKKTDGTTLVWVDMAGYVKGEVNVKYVPEEESFFVSAKSENKKLCLFPISGKIRIPKNEIDVGTVNATLKDGLLEISFSAPQADRLSNPYEIAVK